jgi:L-lactate dehydrogenase
MKKNEIGIIGMGWVGASVAISILQRGLCNRLLINDINSAIAEGEAMDLNHGSSFFPTATTEACDVKDMMDCRAIVITAGRGGKPGESRLDLLKDNVRIAKNISDSLHGYEGLLVIVANPVDVLTYYYQQFTGLPAARVIGTGTMLDTARLREVISRRIQLDPKSIHAHVIGEHGDSEVVLWSRAHIGGMPLRKWPSWDVDYEKGIEDEVRTAAHEIISRKGATNHAIGLVTATLLKWLLRGERRLMTVSSVLDGAYGLKDVAISLPTLITEGGIHQVLEMDIDTSEKKRFLRSAELMQKAIESVAQ